MSSINATIITTKATPAAINTVGIELVVAWFCNAVIPVSNNVPVCIVMIKKIKADGL